MGFSFERAELLLLIPAGAIFILYTSRNMARQAKWRKTLILFLRLASIVLLIACIAGFGLRRVSDTETTVLVLDGSDSTLKQRSEIEEYIKAAIKTKKPSDKVAIVNFGSTSTVEQAPSSKPGFVAIQTKVNGSFTNIEQGLKLAATLIPSADKKRVVLVSDGIENSGDAIKQAQIYKQQGITLDVIPVKTTAANEVQIKTLTVPEALHLNEEFEIQVGIFSTVKTKAIIKLFSDREQVAARNVEIQEGENNFVFRDKASKGGIVTYTAEIVPDRDTIKKNNKISAFSDIEDIARVLVIQGQDEQASELIKILGRTVDITVKRPENVPDTIAELQKFDAFIISNISAENLDDSFLSRLETCIRFQGRGLLVTGGENSYAPGGYYKTVLEKILPVNMDIKPKQEMPNLGLMLVIDKSGSMSEDNTA